MTDQVLEAVQELREHITAEVHRLELHMERQTNAIKGDVGTLKYAIDGVQSDQAHLRAVVTQLQDMSGRDREDHRRDLSAGLDSVRSSLRELEGEVILLKQSDAASAGRSEGEDRLRARIIWMVGTFSALVGILATLGIVRAVG